MQKHIQRYLSIIVCILLLVLSVQQAFAISSIDLTRKGAVTLTFCPDDEPASQVYFRLYKVADVTEKGEYVLTDDFNSYPLTFDDKENIDWRNIATTLTGYVAADGIEPTYDGKTNKDGKLSFNDTELGLYLIIGDPFDMNRTIYTPGSFMLALPDRDENDNWRYNIPAEVKYSSRPDSENTDIEVIKVWNDNNSSNRPDSVTIDLYDGSSLMDSVVLNKSNNWRYTWSDVYGAAQYSVKEENAPSGYYVNIEKKNDTFVITNTKTDEPVKKPERLPQTGMLWWPVPFLAVAGILFVIIGLVRRKGNNYDEEK